MKIIKWREKKKIILLIIIVFFIFYILTRIVEPFCIDNDGIFKITILGVEGEAYISESKEIKDVIRVINGTNAIMGDEKLCEDLGGDTPDILVNFYNDNDDIIHELCFYGSVITYDDIYYRTLFENIQYSKIRRLCKKYGKTTE